MYIGAHVSIAGGLDKSLDRIVQLGGNCLMTFASSPRSLKTPKISQDQISKYLEKKKQYSIGPHFFHGVYLVNLASENKSHVKASINSLIFYQQLASEIEAVGTIFHIGSHKGLGLAETIDQIVAAINYVLDSSPKNTKLIIENAAGQGGTVGADFSEISQIISRVGDRSKIGFCLDTQHAFASGYSLKKVMLDIANCGLINHLCAVHLNDSVTDFASKVDRHANWKEGKIPIDDLKIFLDHPRLKNLPIILEVPGDNHTGPRQQDLDFIKKLATEP